MSKHTEKIDSHKYLIKIDKHIKLLFHKLSRVVTTMEDFHILLSTTSAAFIDLIEST